MENQFTSKNTFKFVNTLYKKARKKAYRQVLARYNVPSKYEFIRLTVGGHIESVQHIMADCTDSDAKIERANELWKSEIECCIAIQYSTKELKISTLKKLNKNSGLLALLTKMSTYGRNFDWAEIVTTLDFVKVVSAYREWCQCHAHAKKIRFKTLKSYASNYYCSYRAWLHKIGAIKQVGRKGLWQLTQFGHDMAKELNDWYDKKNVK